MSSQHIIDTVYILSAGHSGSTLLNLLLGAHSQAASVSELTNLPMNVVNDSRCNCGAVVRECSYWQQVATKARGTLGFDFLQSPRQLELGFIDAPRGAYRGNAWYRNTWKARRIAVYASVLSGIPLPTFMRSRFDLGLRHRLTLYDAVRGASNVPVVIDASKEYLQGIAVYRARPAHTRLILLIRDGRAVFYSNLKRGFGHSFSLRAWRNYYRNALPVVARGIDPRHVLTVRYEDLATDPQKEVRRICEFIGISYEAAMLDTTGKVQHITSGNNMRFRVGTGIKLDTEWCSKLEAVDRAFFERRAGALSRRLGYH